MSTLTDFMDMNRKLFPRDITAGEMVVGDNFVFAAGSSHTVTDNGDFDVEEVPLGDYEVTDTENFPIGGRVLAIDTADGRTTITLDCVDGGCAYTLATDATSAVHASK